MVDISLDSEARDYVMALGYLQAPVVVAGNDHWSGFRPDRIKALARRRRCHARSAVVTTGRVRTDGSGEVTVSNLVYFSSVSENTHRFVEKLGVPAIRIPLHGRIEVDEPYVLVLPTYGGGRATPDLNAGAMSPTGHRLSQQRAQPVADPRRHRGGQQQLRCGVRLCGQTSSPASAACRTCTASN